MSAEKEIGLHTLKVRGADYVLLCDIELADGLSFGIWDGLEVDCPVIFITAYNRYALRAFKVNSIDYLLKPIKEDELGEALNRFDATAKDFIVPHGLITELREATSLRQPVYRTRLRVAVGNDVRALPIDQVAHFYSEDRVTFALDHTGRRYPVSASIGKLTQELDPASWFRINRSQLVHISCVVRAGAYFNHRLKLTLKPAGGGEGIVARERVPAFNAWLGGEH
jgi:DNA-binding LytR/AlgR family response regulator